MRFKEKISGYFQENKVSKICTLVGLCVMVSVSVTLYFTLGKQLLELVKDPIAFRQWLDGFGSYPQIAFVAVRAMQTVCKIIPAEPLEIASGYLFGTFGGLFYCSLGTLLGSLVIIALTKAFGQKIVNIFVPKNKLDEMAFLHDKKKVYGALTVLFLIPGTPKDILTYLVGVTDTNIPLFLLITTFARIPSIITSTWCGGEVQSGNYISAAVIFCVTAVAGAISLAIYKKSRGTAKQGKKQLTSVSGAA